MKILTAALAAILAAPTVQAAEDFSKPDVINADSDCANTKGNEVNETVKIEAPKGKFFEPDTIDVHTENDMRSFTDAARKSGCFMQKAQSIMVPVTTKQGHVVRLKVMTSFEVDGHSDCGSGEAKTAAHILHHDRIRTHCSLKAKLYTEDDLK